jgi:hypothetical protein
MAARSLKIFVVGPHDKARYTLIREYIERVFVETDKKIDLELRVVTPDQNPTTDNFHHWIFRQIDTCDLLVADVTGFNPNVVYEVAFAHSLGVPCAYLRFGEWSVEDEKKASDIKHYFKFTLIPIVTEQELAVGRNEGFDRAITGSLQGDLGSGNTILSDYYGVSPVDAEFVRGLAEGYYRNYLGVLLTAEFKSEFENVPLRILIPDTFTPNDADIRRAAQGVLGDSRVKLANNKLGRTLDISNAKTAEIPFLFDIPSTLLTVNLSHKFIKINEQNSDFDVIDRDRLTDRLARKFVAALWLILRKNKHAIEWPMRQFEIVWLSSAIGKWHKNELLMNSDPLERPSDLW